MSERFDDFSRAMATPRSRRSVLKMFGMAAGGAAVATVLRPFRGSASVTCSGPTNVGASPCAAGTTPCGPCCCERGIACLDAANGVCGCPVRTTPCGSACCKTGTACADPSSSRCATAAVACTQGQVACGATCCSAGQLCNNGACVTPPCPSSVCAGQPNTCAEVGSNSCGSQCFCIVTTEGCNACVDNALTNKLCGPTCTATSDCASGQVCVQNTLGVGGLGCCGGTQAGFCATVCGSGE